MTVTSRSRPAYCAQVGRDGEAALLVRDLVGRPGEEDAHVVAGDLARRRRLAHLVGDLDELVHRVDEQAALLAPRHDQARRPSARGTSRAGTAGPSRRAGACASRETWSATSPMSTRRRPHSLPWCPTILHFPPPSTMRSLSRRFCGVFAGQRGWSEVEQPERQLAPPQGCPARTAGGIRPGATAYAARADAAHRRDLQRRTDEPNRSRGRHVEESGCTRVDAGDVSRSPSGHDRQPFRRRGSDGRRSPDGSRAVTQIRAAQADTTGAHRTTTDIGDRRRTASTRSDHRRGLGGRPRPRHERGGPAHRGDDAASSRASPRSSAATITVLLRRGPPAHRGRARRRQDDARQGARPVDRRTVRRIQFTPDLLPSDVTGVSVFNQDAATLRVPAGRDLRQRRRRRRDQPRLAQDAVRAARVDGGAAGHRRRHDLPAAGAVHRHRDPEPDRDGGHLPPPRGAARPLHDAHLDGLPARRAPSSTCSRATARTTPLDDLAPVTDAETINRVVQPSRRSTRARPCASTSSTSSPARARRRRCGSAPRRVPRCTCCARPGRTPRSRAATTSSPTTCRRSPSPVLAHRLMPSSETQLARRTTAEVVADLLRQVPVPATSR